MSVARALLSLESSVHEIGDPKQEQRSQMCALLSEVDGDLEGER
jgi:hypothetical protein